MVLHSFINLPSILYVRKFGFMTSTSYIVKGLIIELSPPIHKVLGGLMEKDLNCKINDIL